MYFCKFMWLYNVFWMELDARGWGSRKGQEKRRKRGRHSKTGWSPAWYTFVMQTIFKLHANAIAAVSCWLVTGNPVETYSV